MRIKKIISFCFLVLLTVETGRAQIFGDQISATGTMGVYLEAYSRDGDRAMRPPRTARVYLKPTFSVGGMQLHMDLNLSTEQSYISQSYNTFGLTPTWSWGNFSVGDFYPVFSQLTLSHIKVRGAGGKINPGWLRLGFAAGESQQASTKEVYVTYKRMVYAFRMGVGKTSQNFLDLNIVKSEDDPASLANNQDRSVTPQENITGSLNSRITLLQNQLQISSELALSVHSKDVRSALYDQEDIPEQVSFFITPRLSTHLDVAALLEGQLNKKTYGGRAGIKYIGPGYRALGISSLYNDLQTVYINGWTRFLNNRLNIRANLSTQSNNLAGNKLYTMDRKNTSLNVTAVPNKNLNVTWGAFFTTMSNFATRDSLVVDFVSMSMNGGIIWRCPEYFPVQSVRIYGMTLYAKNSNSYYSTQQNETFQLGFSVQSKPIREFVITPNLSMTTAQMGKYPSREIVTLGASAHRQYSSKLSLQIDGSFNGLNSSNSLRGRMRLGYRISPKGKVHVIVRAVEFDSTVPGIQPYSEKVGSVRYEHRF